MKYTLLLSILVCTSVICISQPRKDKPISTTTLIDSLSRKLDHFYIFPEKSLAMAKYLKQQSKAGVYKKITDKNELARKLHDDIRSIHHDGHLRISYDPELASELLKPHPTGPRKPDSAEIRNEKRNNFGFTKTEILNGNIGYVKFTQFNGMLEEAMPVLTAAFGFVSNTDAIILDLRENGGGSPWMVSRIASFFYPEKTRLNDIYERERDTTVAFFADPALAANMKLSQPLYILTSDRTFSAAEDFTYAMQVNKRATIVGDTTGGGAHPTRPIPLGQGFIASIPFARSINHITKTDWEGTGVRPDIAVATEHALERAQANILESRLSSTTDIRGKLALGWALNYLKVHPYDTTFDKAKLQSYSGKFKDFEFSVRDNRIHCVGRFGQTFYLTPIDEDLFLGLDWLQLEFMRDENNNITRLRLLGKPGWEEILERNGDTATRSAR